MILDDNKIKLDEFKKDSEELEKKHQIDIENYKKTIRNIEETYKIIYAENKNFESNLTILENSFKIENEKNLTYEINIQNFSKIKKELENQIYILNQEKNVIEQNLKFTLEEGQKQIEKEKDVISLNIQSNLSLNLENKNLREELIKLVNESKEKEKKNINNLNIIKDNFIKIYENMNKNFISFEKKYNTKISCMKQKISSLIKSIIELNNKNNKIKSKLENKIKSQSAQIDQNIIEQSQLSTVQLKLNLSRSSSDHDEILAKYKFSIEKLESEKQKMLLKIENLEKLIKENNKKKNNPQNSDNNNVIPMLNSKIDWLQKEYNKLVQEILPKSKYELQIEKENNLNLVSKIKELETILEQYKIELYGKSKIIEERNEEIKNYKLELLNSKNKI